MKPALCVLRSSFEWNLPPYDIPDMYAKAGTPCNNYKGYCDVFKKCREVCIFPSLHHTCSLQDESLMNCNILLQFSYE